MPNSNNDSIGLADFINEVKKELMSSPPGPNNIPTHFVESVELELQVTVKKTAESGIKVEIPVFKALGAEAKGSLGRDDTQKVTVKLVPLYDKEKLLDLYQKLNPGQGLAMMEEEMRQRFKDPDETDETVDDGIG